MEAYDILCRLGGGSFADVYKAIEKKTGDYVAIKVLKKKYSNWSECLELREAKSLKKLQEDGKTSTTKGIENIIKLKEMIFIKETGVLNLVFEYMEKDLFELMKQRRTKKLSENQIRSIVYQTLQGLAFMHKYGFFHRDLKPENLLVIGDVIKIADFGLAREIRSIPPYTEYVSTRYYRAPECILKSTNYNSPVDIWALGCIMAEMYLHPQPLFFGNNEKEVLYRICSVLGTPTHSTWAEGIQQAKKADIKFPTCSPTPLSQVIPGISQQAIDILYQMINWDPNKRATANNLLQHPFFTGFSITLQNRFNTSIGESSIDISTVKCDENCNSLNIMKQSSISGVKLYNNGNKLTIKTKEELPQQKRDEEINFSKILNDTEGFDNLINKLKNEKYEDDLDLENNKNIFGSPIHCDKEFDFDGFKDSGPVITQNTLFLGSSNCFRDSSMMNKNITHITGIGQSKNDTIYDYSNGKKFFDSSVVGNINSGITMTSLVAGSNDHMLTNTSVDNNQVDNTLLESHKDISIQNKTINDIASQLKSEKNINESQTNTSEILKSDVFNKEIPKSENSLSMPIPKSNNDNKSEMTFENAKLLKQPLNNNRRRSARKFIEDSEKQGINFITIPQKKEENTINKTSTNPVQLQIPHNNKFQFHQPMKSEFQSRRGKTNIHEKDGENKNPAIHLSKLLENDMVIGNSSYNSNKKVPNSNGFLFGMESRRGHNVNQAKNKKK